MTTFAVCAATFALLALAVVASARTSRLDTVERRRLATMRQDRGFHPTRW